MIKVESIYPNDHMYNFRSLIHLFLISHSWTGNLVRDEVVNDVNTGTCSIN